MNRPIISVTEDNTGLYCPTCGKLKDHLSGLGDGVFTTFSCLNCGQTLGPGILLGLKVICLKREILVEIG